jgi:5-methylcytosine-specific restriction endonuclease McrBC GTP-binding regulatory subunit McrB
MSLPKNMYIWATMNSADQGVYPMDTAFKRRWTFEYMDIDGDDDKNKDYQNYTITIGVTKYKWDSLRKAINETLLASNINEDKCLGPYFIKGDVENKEFASKVLMYLFEDVVKQKPSRVFNDKLKGFSSIYKTSLGAKELKDIFVNDIVQKYEEYEKEKQKGRNHTDLNPDNDNQGDA